MTHARAREPRLFRPADEVLAIDPTALERAWSLFELDEDAPPATEQQGAVAIVDVAGPLESRAGWFWDGYSGAYGIADRFARAMADEGTAAVVLRIASPGGATSGLFEAVDAMRAAATKPVVAFCETAFSAGYALATVAERVVVSRAGGVGSIGVIATAFSYEKALEKEGVAVAVVASGAQKTDLHPALPLSDAAVARMRGRVTALAGMFADEVARARGTTREAVLGLQAALYHGQAAVDAGLADAVGSLDAAVGAARELVSQRAAEAAAKESEMAALAIATMLGLAAAAPEAEVAARAGSLRDLESALASATGESSSAKILERVRAWKADAAEVAGLRERTEKAETAERSAYVAEVCAARNITDEATRRVYERDAKANWTQFQTDFPRPSAAEKAARAGDPQRLGRLPADPAGATLGARAQDTVVTVAAADEPTDAQLADAKMTRAQWNDTQARMRRDMDAR